MRSWPRVRTRPAASKRECPPAGGCRERGGADQRAAGFECALRAQVNVAADRIVDDVEIRNRVAEIRGFVIDDRVGAQRSDEFRVAGARRSVDRRAAGFAVPNREGADAACGGMDEDLHPFLDVAVERDQRRMSGERSRGGIDMRDGSRFFERNAGRDRLRAAAPAGWRAGAERLVPDREFRRIRSRADDRSRQVASGNVGEVEFRTPARKAVPRLPVVTLAARTSTRTSSGSGMSARRARSP